MGAPTTVITEQVKPEVRLLSTPMVVVMKISGVVPAMLPAGAVAVALKLYELIRFAEPEGPPASCGTMVQGEPQSTWFAPGGGVAAAAGGAWELMIAFC